MLDVAIGMIFIYLQLSLMCSAINEIIEAWLKNRAVDLERGIRELLQEKSGVSSITAKLYEHPLIFGLFKGSYDPTKVKKERYALRSDLPSYIPARNFALALMDVVLPAKAPTPATPAGTAGGTMGATAPPVDVELVKVVNVIPPADPLQPLRNSISTSSALVGNDKLKQALLSLINAAGSDAGRARENIENWFNSSMDRVSGWYKRRTQTILLILGFVLAGAVNADTFTIFRSLANDAPLRDAFISAAAQPQNPADNQKTPQVRLAEAEAALSKAGSTIYGLSIGWNWKSDLNPGGQSNLQAIPKGEDIGLWVLKVIGWLVTGIAVSLGAPFWFDLLNKVMVIRSTVKPHEKSPEESSEDRQR